MFANPTPPASCVCRGHCALSRRICSRKTALIQFVSAKSLRPLNSSRPITDTKRWRLSPPAALRRTLYARGVAFAPLRENKGPTVPPAKKVGGPTARHWPASVGRSVRVGPSYAAAISLMSLPKITETCWRSVCLPNPLK